MNLIMEELIKLLLNNGFTVEKEWVDGLNDDVFCVKLSTAGWAVVI